MFDSMFRCNFDVVRAGMPEREASTPYFEVT